MKKNMTFIEVLQSEYYYLVEAIEHGSSDPEVIESYREELYKKTGWKRDGWKPAKAKKQANNKSK